MDLLTISVAIIACIGLMIGFLSMFIHNANRKLLDQVRLYLNRADIRGQAIKKVLCNDLKHTMEALPSNVSKAFMGALNRKTGHLTKKIDNQIDNAGVIIDTMDKKSAKYEQFVKILQFLKQFEGS